MSQARRWRRVIRLAKYCERYPGMHDIPAMNRAWNRWARHKEYAINRPHRGHRI